MLTTTITPRVSETDGAGHINNTFVPVWFEAGRLEIFRALTPDLSFGGWRVALVNMNVDYRAQLYFGVDCQIETWIEHVGNKSFKVGERVLQRGQVCAEGTCVYVYFDIEAQKSLVIPDKERAWLESHLPSGPTTIDQ